MKKAILISVWYKQQVLHSQQRIGRDHRRSKNSLSLYFFYFIEPLIPEEAIELQNKGTIIVAKARIKLQ